MDLRRRVLDSIDALSSWVLSCQKNKRGCVLNFYQNIKSQTSYFFLTQDNPGGWSIYRVKNPSPQIRILVSIATNKSLDGKIQIHLSSADNFNSMGYTTSIPGIEKNVQETRLNSDTASDVIFKEEATEFIKDCTTQTSFFKCWADNFLAAQPEDFNCTKKCVPLFYGAIVNTTVQGFIKHSLIRSY